MKLYYMPGTCAMADHIVLEWIGQPYEAVKVAREELKSPAYLSINPNGQVPALVEADGWALTENIAILNYLADTFPVAELGGSGKRGRAEVNRWLAYLNSEVHPAFKPLFAPQRFTADETAHTGLQEGARAKLRFHFERIESQLSKHPWLAGTRSIADPYLFVVIRWAKGKHVDLQGLRHVESYFQRMHDDKDVQTVMRDEGI